MLLGIYTWWSLSAFWILMNESSWRACYIGSNWKAISDLITKLLCELHCPFVPKVKPSSHLLQIPLSSNYKQWRIESTHFPLNATLAEEQRIQKPSLFFLMQLSFAAIETVARSKMETISIGIFYLKFIRVINYIELLALYWYL